MPRGRKTCHKCKKEQGVRTYICECGYNFSENKKEPTIKKKEKKEEEISPLVKEILEANIPTPKEYKGMSPKEHAKRILNYGKKRASTLLLLARVNKYWKHVDWDVVEQGLI